MERFDEFSDWLLSGGVGANGGMTGSLGICSLCTCSLGLYVYCSLPLLLWKVIAADEASKVVADDVAIVFL